MIAIYLLPGRVTRFLWLPVLLWGLLSVELGAQPIRHIGNIKVEQADVFDTTGPFIVAWIGRIGNALHIMTKEGVIRKEILQVEGQPYDSLLIAETERNLRQISFLGDIKIKKDFSRPDTVDLTVKTRDKWSMGFNVSYRQEAGIRSGYVSLSDDNFLGYGQKISANYNFSSSRAVQHGVEAYFTSLNIAGSHWDLKTQYKDSEELRIKTILFERGFFSDYTRWAGSVYFDDGKMEYLNFKDGKLSSRTLVSVSTLTMFAAYSFGKELIFRTGISYLRNRQSPLEYSTGGKLNTDLPAVSAGIMKRRYVKEQYINSFGRDEDVPLGWSAAAQIGGDVRSGSHKKSKMYSLLSFQSATQLTENYYTALDAAVNGFWGGGRAEDISIGLRAIQNLRVSRRQLISARITGLWSVDWTNTRTLYLDSRNGMRGYQAYELCGSNYLLGNFEDRIFSDLSFYFFKIGAAVFYDACLIWQAGQSNANSLHSACGLGLRIENLWQKGSGLVRVDFVFNNEKRKFAEIILTTEQFFSAIQAIGIPLSVN